MIRMSLISLIGLVIAVASQPQSSVELSAKYPVITSYEVRPGIVMTPKYTDDGKICEMSFERLRATKSGVMMDSYMSENLVREIVDELAPDLERGSAARGDGMATTGK